MMRRARPLPIALGVAGTLQEWAALRGGYCERACGVALWFMPLHSHALALEIDSIRDRLIDEARHRGERLLVLPKSVPEYYSLRNALRRCHDPRNAQWPDYGGRGIGVCEAWRDPVLGFYRFLAHVGRRHDRRLTLDRIDNDRGYEPGNVRWATRAVQSANRRLPGGRLRLR